MVSNQSPVKPRACPWSPEKPWFTPVITEFLICDVPRLLGCPQQLFARDVQTLERRLAAEGESFLTKTLPAFGKCIDLALQGHVPLRTPSFKKQRGTALPAFLQALLGRVFQDDGWVRVNPNHMAIRLVRQLCLWFKKLEREYSDESLQRARIKYKETDAALPTAPDDLSGSRDLLDVARALVERIMVRCEHPSKALPKHGPGAVADGGGTLGKRYFGIRFKRLESMFKPIPWFYSMRDAAECYELITSRPTSDEAWGVLRFVNKDSGGPRVIVIMPGPVQWAQQALKRVLYAHIDYGRHIARRRINFERQDINRELALDWRKFDTTDLSEASDRNSYVLTHDLWKNTGWWAWLDASRTIGTVLPGGEAIFEKKFAPMGSAVCFPVMAINFWAIAVAAQHLAGMPLFLACRNTYIYGDDLILPHGHYEVVNSAFTKLGLKFNESKCCVHGKFRESCGMDAYDGVSVTPIRMKSDRLDERTDLVRLVRHTNNLMIAGYWSTASKMRELTKRLIAEKDLRISLPISSRSGLPILTWHSAPWETETLRVRLKDGISKVKGWYYAPSVEQSSLVLERFHLRESLCLGGPVGSLHYEERAVNRSRRPYPEDFGPRITGTLPRFVRRDRKSVV